MCPRRRPLGARPISCSSPAVLAVALLAAAGCRRTGSNSHADGPHRAAIAVQPTSAPAAGSEERGRRIYQKGESPSGAAIIATIRGGTEVPAGLVACVNCHGGDGRAIPEGAIVPPDLTWASLTGRDGTVRPDGRRRPPYDAALIKRAVTMGIDSGGATLDEAMPRYRLSIGDADDLVTYLGCLGHDPDPGVGDSEVTLGVVLPPDAADNGLNASLRGVLDAYAAAVNDRGGVYHRRISWRYATPGIRGGVMDSPALDAGGQPVFAWLVAILAGGDLRLAAQAGRDGIPLVEVVASTPANNVGPVRPVFSLLAGPDDQAVALARHVLGSAAARARIAVVRSDGPAQEALARSIGDRCRSLKLGDAIEVEVPAGAPPDAGRVSHALEGASAVILLGPPGGIATLLGVIAGRGDPPFVLVPSGSARGDLLDAPPALDDRLRLALPIAPTDATAEGLAEYDTLTTRHGLSTGHRPAQLAALAGAKVLVEGLRRVGRDLTRGRLIDSLEGLREFRTGLCPPVSFGPNRRVGAPGAHPVAVDLGARRLVPAGPWIDAYAPPGPDAR
jgi:hypothetical protein